MIATRVIATRPLARAVVALVAASLIAACQPQTVTPSPTPSASASPTALRPRFELSTYAYAIQTKGKIRIAVRGGFPPMSDATVTGNTIAKPQGFEPDLGREIAKAIFGTSDDPDSHIDWVSVDNSTRVVALTSAQADISIAAIPTTDDNTKVVDMSDPYFRAGQRLLVKKANDQIKEIADVASGEQTVCAQKGSPSETELKKVTNDRAKILDLDTLDFCMQALMTGAADAVVGDEIALYGIVSKQPNDVKLAVKTFAPQQLGIAMKKNAAGDRQGFRDFINTTLLTLVANRTWAKLYQKDIAPVSGDTKQLPTD